MSLEETIAKVVEEAVRRVVREELDRRQAEEAVSIEEAAKRLGVSVSTVRREIKDRKIPASRIRGRICVRVADLAPRDETVIDLAARARAR